MPLTREEAVELLTKTNEQLTKVSGKEGGAMQDYGNSTPHYRWSREAQREVDRIRRWRWVCHIRHTIVRLWDAIPWAFGRGTVMGQAYCPHCEREIDDCEIR